MPPKKPKLTDRARKDKNNEHNRIRRENRRTTQTPEERRAELDHQNVLQRARRQSQEAPRRTLQVNTQRRLDYANLSDDTIDRVRSQKYRDGNLNTLKKTIAFLCIHYFIEFN